MWFSLFAAVLVLAVTFYQGLQGLFSALIACILTILAAGLAFGVYEDIYYWQLIGYQPDYGRAIALVGVFIVALLVLRVLFDQLITGNMQFPVYVDRAGGGVFGFVTAMIIIGMLAIGFQMLPFGATLLGFTRYSLTADGKPVVKRDKENEERKDVVFRDAVDWSSVRRERHGLWLNPDGFTIGVVSYLSDNALAGRNHLAEWHPELLDSLHYARDGLYCESLAAVAVDAVRVHNYWYRPEKSPMFVFEPEKDRVRPRPSGQELPEGRRRLVVRATISEDSGPCKDPKSWHFTTRQVRLLGRERKGGPTVVYPLAGIRTEGYGPGWFMELLPDQDVQIGRAKGKAVFDLVFDVPADSAFEPGRLEYKQNAWADVLSGTLLEKEPPVAPAEGLPAPGDDHEKPEPTEPPGPKPPKPDKHRPDRVSSLTRSNKPSYFSDKLPFVLTDYRKGYNFEARGGAIRSGQLTAKLDDDWEPLAGLETPIDSLDVPNGMRLLHLGLDTRVPRSWIGKLYGGAVTNVRDFYLVDTEGQNHPPVGAYAIADVDGKPRFELIYMDEEERIGGRLRRFDTIKRNDMETSRDYALYFLFHLGPGTRPKEFHTGGLSNVPLTDLDLEAPK